MELVNPFVSGLGLFLRDLYAMHAPARPEWFNVPNAARPLMAKEATEFWGLPGTDRLRNAYFYIYEEGMTPLASDWPVELPVTPEEVQQLETIRQQTSEHYQARMAAGEVDQWASRTAWPLAWADAMLAARLTHPQPTTTLNGFKPGDVVTLIQPANDKPGDCTIVSLNFDDPSRPAMTVVPCGNTMNPETHRFRFRTDPGLWRRAKAGDVVTIVANAQPPAPAAEADPFVASSARPLPGVRILDDPEYLNNTDYDVVLEIDGDAHHAITPAGAIHPFRWDSFTTSRLVERRDGVLRCTVDVLRAYVEKYRTAK